jgi:pimeloyl-ACP methyl ester carboxylesterase
VRENLHDVKLNHDRRGSGDPLVLIHGIGGEWEVWGGVIDRLAVERDVIALDLPGFGRSPVLAAGESPDAPGLARAVDRFLDELGVGQVDLAGHSLGGWVVLELAKLGRARSVAALCPGGFFTPAERTWAKWLLRFSAWSARRYGEWIAPRWESPRTRKLLLGGSFGHPERVPPEAIRRITAALAAAPGWDATLAATARQRFSGGEQVDAPVTLVWGTRDRLLRPRQAKRAQREIPGAKLVWLEGAGHFVQWDEPERVAAVLLGLGRQAVPAQAAVSPSR